MRLVKILLFGFIGLIVGLGGSHILSSGYSHVWNKLPSPPSPIAEFIAVGEGDIIAKTTNDTILRCSSWRDECWVRDDISEYHFDSTRITRPCDLSSSEFRNIKINPENIIDCIQGVTQYPEGIGRYTYVLDINGNIWEWSYIFAGSDTLYALFAPYCCSSLGIILGVIIFSKKRKLDIQS
jgi:hypothetical protein